MAQRRASQRGAMLAGSTRVELVVEALQERPGLVAIDAGVGVPSLDPQLIIQRLADHLEDRLLGRAHSALGVAQDLPGDQLGLVKQSIVRHNLHDEVALQGAVSVDRLRGQHQLPSPRPPRTC